MEVTRLEIDEALAYPTALASLGGASDRRLLAVLGGARKNLVRSLFSVGGSFGSTLVCRTIRIAIWLVSCVDALVERLPVLFHDVALRILVQRRCVVGYNDGRRPSLGGTLSGLCELLRLTRSIRVANRGVQLPIFRIPVL